ncbi:hypothetical protein Y032_0404g843 [Ancylostoma ceylanicum]|uniref:Uncharacterized protein n=1 Tax=Ancylostoma ceylanicum TaxID=53326 RepID=A0A016X305_9BILA|nr:hypothetical protein Y032_0404g843 [Ancylostoma ceylanicum]
MPGYMVREIPGAHLSKQNIREEGAAGRCEDNEASSDFWLVRSAKWTPSPARIATVESNESLADPIL